MSVITLGVRDKQRARTFYETLGWRGVGGTGEEPVFFQAGEMIVASGTAPTWQRTPACTTAADGAV